jgi:hypothetical protein
VRDRRFIKALYRAHRLPAPNAQHVDISYYGDVAGYCLDIVKGRRVFARIAWCPQIERRAHAPKGLPSGRADVAALNALVARFLKKHAHGLTQQDCIDITAQIIRLLGDAIALRQWSDARRLWALAAPLHAMLITREPSYAFVDAALAENEAIDGPCSSAIH